MWLGKQLFSARTTCSCIGQHHMQWPANMQTILYWATKYYWRVEWALLVNSMGNRMYVCNYRHCTYRNVIIYASNFACTLSRSPTMCSIQLVSTDNVNRSLVHLSVCLVGFWYSHVQYLNLNSVTHSGLPPQFTHFASFILTSVCYYSKVCLHYNKSCLVWGAWESGRLPGTCVG